MFKVAYAQQVLRWYRCYLSLQVLAPCRREGDYREIMNLFIDLNQYLNYLMSEPWEITDII